MHFAKAEYERTLLIDHRKNSAGRCRARRSGHSERFNLKIIKAGARSSPLSRAQWKEIQTHPLLQGCILEPVWVETTGDKDKKTSLRSLEKTDFFTKELDQLLLEGSIRIAIHSAKDLPDPLPHGLQIVALTRGVDPRDSLVFRFGESLSSLALGATVATSSLRREEAVLLLRSDLQFIDIRGTIEERLAFLERKEVDAVVIAEAALIRLHLTHYHRLILPGEAAPLQGRLAVISRKGDDEMKALFSRLSA